MLRRTTPVCIVLATSAIDTHATQVVAVSITKLEQGEQ